MNIKIILLNLCIILGLAFLIIQSSCSKEDFSIYQLPFDQDSPIQENYFEILENSIVVEENMGFKVVALYEDYVELIVPAGVTIEKDDILLSFGNGTIDSKSFYRKVITIQGGSILKVYTSDLALHEAFARYSFDSRRIETIVTRSLPAAGWEIKIKPSSNFVFSFQGLVKPEFDFDFNFGPNSYICGGFDPDNEIVPWFDINIKDAFLTATGKAKFIGTIAAGFNEECIIPPGAVPVFPIGTTGLSVYVLPKLELFLKLIGEIESPTYGAAIGPIKIRFLFNPNLYTTVRDTFLIGFNEEQINSGWESNGNGILDAKFGAELFVSTALPIPNPPKLCSSIPFKIGVYNYINFLGTISSSGNFENLRPTTTYNIDLKGSGKVFASTKMILPSFLPSWAEVGTKFEKSYVNFDLYSYHYDDPFCQQYEYVNFQATSNGISINAECSTCPGNYYNIWINNKRVAQPFLFGQNYTFQLPFDLDLVNTIQIADTLKRGCVLSHSFENPTFNLEGCNVYDDGFNSGDGYCTVQIGGQLWLSQNLRDRGDGTAENSIGVWPNENIFFGQNLYNATNVFTSFGRLYTFEEILNGETPNFENENRKIQGICPPGYHIPSKAEFVALKNYLKDNPIGGANSSPNRDLKFPSSTFWPNSSLPSQPGFGAVPAGEYYPYLNVVNPLNKFGHLGMEANFWTSTVELDFPKNSVYILKITEDDAIVGIGETNYKSVQDIGYSCRCLRD